MNLLENQKAPEIHKNLRIFNSVPYLWSVYYLSTMLLFNFHTRYSEFPFTAIAVQQ